MENSFEDTVGTSLDQALNEERRVKEPQNRIDTSRDPRRRTIEQVLTVETGHEVLHPPGKHDRASSSPKKLQPDAARISSSKRSTPVKDRTQIPDLPTSQNASPDQTSIRSASPSRKQSPSRLASQRLQQALGQALPQNYPKPDSKPSIMAGSRKLPHRAQSAHPSTPVNKSRQTVSSESPSNIAGYLQQVGKFGSEGPSPSKSESPQSRRSPQKATIAARDLPTSKESLHEGSHRIIGSLPQPVISRPRFENDTYRRLYDDSQGGIEYVKGVGAVQLEKFVQVEPPNAFTFGDDTAQYEDDTFEVKSFSSTSRFETVVCLRWKAEQRIFEVCLGEKQDVTCVRPEDVESMFFSHHARCIHFLGGKNQTKAPAFEDFLLDVSFENDEGKYHKLRSFSERRVGGIKASPKPPDYFRSQEDIYQQSREGRTSHRAGQGRPRRPGPSNLLRTRGGFLQATETVETSTDKSDPHATDKSRSLQDTPKKRPKSVGSRNNAPHDTALNSPSKRISQRKSENPSDSLARIRGQDDPTRGQEMKEISDSADNLLHLAEQAVLESSADFSRAQAQAVASNTGHRESGLRYLSNQTIHLNDLVVRLRDASEINRKSGKFDDLDIFDGPWPVVEVPSSAETPAGLFDNGSDVIGEKNSELSRDGTNSGLNFLRSKKLIKLGFPEGSKAEPWTSLDRIIPVFEVDADAREASPRQLYDLRKEPRVAHQVVKNDRNEDSEDEDRVLSPIVGVCKIKKDHFVKVSYVESAGPGAGNTFEVEKLRGKKIWLYRKRDFKEDGGGEDDSMVKNYLDNEGRVAEDEVLVVKYLVHWAGWPTEDDTWEVGAGNIPSEFMDDYNEAAGNNWRNNAVFVVDETGRRAKKKRKSSTSRAVAVLDEASSLSSGGKRKGNDRVVVEDEASSPPSRGMKSRNRKKPAMTDKASSPLSGRKKKSDGSKKAHGSAPKSKGSGSGPRRGS